jgi:hypothetical protein
VGIFMLILPNTCFQVEELLNQHGKNITKNGKTTGASNRKALLPLNYQLIKTVNL